MKNLSLLLGLLILLTGCQDKSTENQQTKTDQTTGEFKKSESGSSLLWEITGNGLVEPSYLFGTIHIIPEKDFYTSPVIEDAFANCENLVMEVGNLGGSATEMLANKAYLLDSGTIKDHVSPDIYEDLVKAVDRELGMTEDQFLEVYGKMQPFVLYSSLTYMQGGEGPDMGDTKSYEMYFSSLAFKHDIYAEGLETLNDQMGFFSEIPADTLIKDAVKQLNNTGEEGESNMMQKIVDVYKSHDLEALGKFTMESDDFMRNYTDVLLFDRNKAWIPKIETAIQKEPCFIAVGAGHLPGEQGVIELLRNEGYTVEPLEI